MTPRVINTNISLVGFGFIFISLVSFIYLIHKTHHALEETRLRLRFSEEKLNVMTRQFEAMNDCKIRLEKDFISLKSKRASALETEQSEKEEIDTIKLIHFKQIQSLQNELKSCTEKLPGDTGPSGFEILSHMLPNMSSALHRHIQNLNVKTPGNSGAVGEHKSIFNQNPENGGNAFVPTSPNPNPSPQHIQPPPPSGNPNEDPVGNVFI